MKMIAQKYGILKKVLCGEIYNWDMRQYKHPSDWLSVRSLLKIGLMRPGIQIQYWDTPLKISLISLPCIQKIHCGCVISEVTHHASWLTSLSSANTAQKMQLLV